MYDADNALGAKVFDVDGRIEIRHVAALDDATGVVTAFHHPYRLLPGSDEADTYEIRFQSICPIFGGGTMPVLFHCYGRIQ